MIPGSYWIFQPKMREIDLVGKTRQEIIELINNTPEDKYLQGFIWVVYESPQIVYYTNKSPYYGGRFDLPLTYQRPIRDYEEVKLYRVDDRYEWPQWAKQLRQEYRKNLRKLMKARSKYWVVFHRRAHFVSAGWCIEFNEHDVVISQVKVITS